MDHSLHVLIVPFMELKLNLWMLSEKPLRSLNRTFYGIETCLVGGIGHQSDVLIVPFMELKPSEEKAQKKVAKGLNRTIKTNAGVKEGFFRIEFQFHKRYD